MRAGDHLARVLITVGGIGTMVAVATVCLFLVAVVLPLFQPAHIEPAGEAATDWTPTPVHLDHDQARLDRQYDQPRPEKGSESLDSLERV